eukprot:scaffold57835_cov63-Phaeocystis_antarctica.AAC.3
MWKGSSPTRSGAQTPHSASEPRPHRLKAAPSAVPMRVPSAPTDLSSWDFIPATSSAASVKASSPVALARVHGPQQALPYLARLDVEVRPQEVNLGVDVARDASGLGLLSRATDHRREHGRGDVLRHSEASEADGGGHRASRHRATGSGAGASGGRRPGRCHRSRAHRPMQLRGWLLLLQLRHVDGDRLLGGGRVVEIHRAQIVGRGLVIARRSHRARVAPDLSVCQFSRTGGQRRTRFATFATTKELCRKNSRGRVVHTQSRAKTPPQTKSRVCRARDRQRVEELLLGSSCPTATAAAASSSSRHPSCAFLSRA